MSTYLIFSPNLVVGEDFQKTAVLASLRKTAFTCTQGTTISPQTINGIISMFDLLQAMHSDGFLTAQETTALRKTCRLLGENQVRLLRSLNISTAEQIQDYLQKYFHVSILNVDPAVHFDPSYRSYLPEDLAIFYHCFSIGEEDGSLYLAMEDPTDIGTIAQLRFFLNKRIKAVSATVYQISEGLKTIYDIPASALLLNTPIETARGIVGGFPYQEVFISRLDIEDTFEGLGLEDEESSNAPEQDYFSQVKSSDNLAPPPAEPTAPPVFEFIDGSSGSVDPDLFKIEEKGEIKAEQEEGLHFASEENALQENKMISNEEELESGTDSIQTSEEDVPQELMERIALVTNKALVKLSLIFEQKNALHHVNLMLSSCGVKIRLVDNTCYFIEGENFSKKCLMGGEESKSHQGPIDTLVKNIMRLE